MKATDTKGPTAGGGGVGSVRWNKSNMKVEAVGGTSSDTDGFPEVSARKTAAKVSMERGRGGRESPL